MNRFQMSRRNRLALFIVVAISLPMVVCMGKKTAQLEIPYSDSTQTHAAVKQAKGIHMEVTPDSPWSESVKVNATPLQVTIRNNGQAPLVLRYEYFVLYGDNGEQFAALPLFDFRTAAIAGAAPQPAKQYTPMSDTRFEQTGFNVAPYYAAIYPQTPVAPSVFLFNESYYQAYGGELGKADLPPEVYKWVIPEGILQSGGSIKGVLLFEPVDPKLRSVTFRSSLVNGNGRMVGFIAIPFLVKRQAEAASR
jgi:hypothetical protein